MARYSEERYREVVQHNSAPQADAMLDVAARLHTLASALRAEVQTLGALSERVRPVELAARRMEKAAHPWPDEAA